MSQGDASNYVDYVFLIPGKEFSKEFLISWSNTLTYLLDNGISFRYSILYTPIVSDVRNSLLVSPLISTHNEKTNDVFSGSFFCKRVIFIDSDIVWSLKDLEKLLFTDKDFLSGVYSTQDGQHVSILVGSRKLMTVEEFLKKKEPFEVLATGFGFVSCSYKMLNEMKYPWFSIVTPESVHENVIGEDSYFCFKASKKGFKLVVDPTIKLGHEKTLQLVL